MSEYSRATLILCLLAGPSHLIAQPLNSTPPKKQPAASSAEQDYASELPKIAPKSPEQSLQAMNLKPGFHAELVAAEPLIRSPMAIDFDEYRRAFVVELPEYNQYGSQEPHGKGAIKLLEDSDRDGRYDKATEYVDNLDYPTAVACWDGGVLVGVAPDILYCKDTNGDGIADVRRKLFTGFGQDKAGEGMLNSFRWRIDNRFHIPTGLDGGEIVRVGGDEQSQPKGVRGQHLLLEPRTMTIETTSGGGQHGMSLDDWNLRSFVCGNSEPVHAIMYDGRYLARNPYLQAPAAAINIAPDGKFTKLMRISNVEPWRVLRTRLRSQGIIPGSDEGGTPSGFFTGATGITVYRGDAWPKEYRGSIFVGEVANNLVYRARVETSGVDLVAHRADSDAEFLASSDNWFRPVQFANAPDGTLYVLDMYRELIEGAAFLAPQILKHMDTSAGANQGRIYRIAPDGFQYRAAPRIGDMSTIELVPLLEHDNAWHRETAARLLYQRQDVDAVDPLRRLVATSPSGLARVTAAYSLAGLGALEPALLTSLFESPIVEVRQHALRLAENFPKIEPVLAAVIQLARDESLAVRYQAAFSLGAFEGPTVVHTLAQLADKDGHSAWMQLAILSSIGNSRSEFIEALLAGTTARGTAHIQSMINQAAAQIAASGSKDELARLLAQIEVLLADPQTARFSRELVRSLVAKQPTIRGLIGDQGGQVRELIDTIVKEATLTAAAESQKLSDRVAAIRSLAAADFSQSRKLFAELLRSRQPQPVQSAVLETLARFENAEVAQLIISAWASQTPQLRATSLETLFSRPTWILAFLDAVEQKIVARADVDPARVALLGKHDDKLIRDQTAKLLSSNALTARQEVVDAYQRALEIQGNIERGREHFRKSCAACHRLEGFGESTGADLNAIRDRGLAAVLLNILDPNREVKPQFLSYAILLDTDRTITGLISAETANSLTIRKADNTTETVLRVNIEQIKSTGLSFMPEGLEKQLDVSSMADLLAYLNSIK